MTDRRDRRGACRAALVAAAVLASAALARAGEVFRGDAELRLGERVHAAFPERAPGPHRYTFFASAGTSLSAVVRADGDASLVPSVRLAYVGGEAVELRRPRAAGARVPVYEVPYSGLYVLEVAARRGAGGYTLETAGRLARASRSRYPRAPAGDASFAFEAPAGARVTARVEPIGRGPLLEITRVIAPGGEPIPVLSITRGSAAEIRDVPLTEGGLHRLAWHDRGTGGDLRVTFRFEFPARARAVRELGVSDGAPLSLIERGDPVLAARAGYVGSAACGRCHGDLVRTWSQTAHNAAVRSWSRAGAAGAAFVNDADGNGHDDFEDGLDLGALPAFAAFGAAAPRLSRAEGEGSPYVVRIGAATYRVERTMGGNGLWRQRYLAKVGRTYHALPFEFDETLRTYVPYDTSAWYDAANAPLPAPVASRSFEAQCSGCHGTGAVIEPGSAAGEFVTGYVEMNIGCEQCHGPGAAHAAGGDVRKIRNPRRLVDGTAAGAAAAADVCARCHTDGAAVDALPLSDVHPSFPYRRDRGVAEAGDALVEFLVATTDPAAFWGAKANPLPGVPGDTSIARRGDRPHGADLAAGAHAAISGDAALCFDCHDPHARRAAHQVTTAIDRGTRVATRSDDDTLCLSCHAGGAEFPSITAADVALVRGAAAPAVAAAVTDHMADNGMPVRADRYDPRGSGVGRCTSCHMPKTGSTGPSLPDAGGFARGNLSSHRFLTVSPTASARHGVTNSCSGCHPTGADDRVGPILAQWASAAPGRTAFHGAAPPASGDGRALEGRLDPARGESACVRCHTADGFRRLAVNPRGEAAPVQAEIDALAKSAIARERGVACDACHGRRSDGRFHGDTAIPLRLPKDELCASCHDGGGVTFADFRDRGLVPHFPQAPMLAGSAGAAPPGAADVATTAHSFLPGGCVACHHDTARGAADHRFTPSVATCASCHPGLATFDRTAAADYDGDGTVRGVQTEVAGLLDRLKAALLLDPSISFAAGRFDRGGATDHALAGATSAQKRAAFNWIAVNDDGSRGVHDAARAIQLLQASYRELTGADVPGAVIR